MAENYLEINRESWNKRTDIHIDSEFYDNKTFIAGRNSLNSIELDLLGSLEGKKVLHLQCHFGQDTISLCRLGAEATGIDLSDRAIAEANKLAKQCGQNTQFVCSDIYDLPNNLNEQFDVVFTSYGTIGWLPDLDRWAGVIKHFLKPGGSFVFAEFHPAVWMFDDNFNEVAYSYFKATEIVELNEGTYTDGGKDLEAEYVSWNHGLSEVFNSLKNAGFQLTDFNEFDYSPYPCFNGVKEVEKGKWIIDKMGNKLPLVYSLKADLVGKN